VVPEICRPGNMSARRKYVGPKNVGPAKICRPGNMSPRRKYVARKKKNFGGAAPEPPAGGPPPPLTPLRARRRCSDTTTRAKNITHTQHSPTCCFLCTQGVTGLHSQQSRASNAHGSSTPRELLSAHRFC
jgi:hypothetical protein